MNIIRTHALGRDDGGYQPPGMQYKINIIPRANASTRMPPLISVY